MEERRREKENWRRAGEVEERRRRKEARGDSKFESRPTIVWRTELRCATEFFPKKILAGKNLDFAVTFYSFEIYGFCKFQNSQRPSKSL